MENVSETYNNSENSNDPNATSHYMLILVAVVVGLAGIMLRFLGSWHGIDAVSNIILVVGVVIALKAVRDILK